MAQNDLPNLERNVVFDAALQIMEKLVCVS